MSDFEDFYNRELPLLMFVGLITLPIWIIPYSIWYCYDTVTYKKKSLTIQAPKENDNIVETNKDNKIINRIEASPRIEIKYKRS